MSENSQYHKPSIHRLFYARNFALAIGVSFPLSVCAQAHREAKPSESSPVELPSGDSIIRSAFGPSEIVITTTSRLAGAIHSLTWNDQEFINSKDHGRQLQSASNFDASGKFTPETFNPTEAGSMSDGAGDKSTSRLLHLVADGNQLQTTSQVAFWLRPGQNSAGYPAKNNVPLSNHTLTKRVTIGFEDLTNVISYDVTFGIPLSESHKFAQFEALTGYMPPEFSRFLTCDPETGETHSLFDGPGEQPLPIIFAKPNGTHAMGIYVPRQETPTPPSYGRWNFKSQRVVKWNCVFRYRDKTQVRAGEYAFRCFVIVGTEQDVVDSMQKLHSRMPSR